MNYSNETIKEFKVIIDQIHSYNINLISALSLFAEEYKNDEFMSTAFVEIIITKINETDKSEKIFFFYVLDYILKNVGCLFTLKFSEKMKEIFKKSNLPIIANNIERINFFEMVKLWSGYLSMEIIDYIDSTLKTIDINWQTKLNNDNYHPLNNEINETLKSLPIISYKSKSEKFISFEKSLSESSNDSIFSPSPPVELNWEVKIFNYPLFPNIGTDPRLLRQWHSKEILSDITINNLSYKLHLNRIQPCIYIDDCLHAIRFYSKSIKIRINKTIVDLPLMGVISANINGKNMQIALGGPGHELIIHGDPYTINMNGKLHYRSVSNETFEFQFIINYPVQVVIMPAIPSFINQWAWEGKFGSPKHLHLNPLNPMKPNFSLNGGEFRAPFDNLESTLNIVKPENGVVTKENIAIEKIQKRNMCAVVKLYDVLSIKNKNPEEKQDFYRAHYQFVNDWIVSESPSKTDKKMYTTKINSYKSDINHWKIEQNYEELCYFESEINKDFIKNWDIVTLDDEEILVLTTEKRNSFYLIRGTAEIWGNRILNGHKIELLENSSYEIVSFTGCQIVYEHKFRTLEIRQFYEDNYNANILLNIHEYIEEKRLDSFKKEERGPRILVYGPGVDTLTMSSISILLANYAVRYGETVGLVNLDTTYNESSLPNSISVNIVQTELSFVTKKDYRNEQLVFNFGHCSPFINSSLFFEQLSALANLVNIRCENDNELLRGGCVINGGSYHSLEVTKKAVEIFEVNLLLIIGDKNFENLKFELPNFVEIIQMPKRGFDSGYCPKKVELIRRLSIERYFFTGNDFYRHTLKVSMITFYETTEKCSVYTRVTVEEIIPNSIGALLQAISEDEMITSPVLLYCIFVSYSKENSTLSLLANGAKWPQGFSNILLSGNIWT